MTIAYFYGKSIPLFAFFSQCIVLFSVQTVFQMQVFFFCGKTAANMAF